ncbi:MAG: TRAP transporter substrate-binding protein DctP [Gammaproteobacteria bacterium]|nr:TRAP transporter substrate-binding protein DctP [Gammaproteobacteria bacterium]
MVLKQLLLLFIFIHSASVFAKDSYVLKFATLVPPDTAWMNEVSNWSNILNSQSNGRLTLKIYPGGVMGDEPDVLRKIRSNQLQGAFFTGYGVGRIYSPARVLELPFLFKTSQESDYVRDRLMPEIEKGFSKNGFKLLGWPEVGFVHFFSKKPIHSLNDLKQSRIWIWQGDRLGESFSKAANISHIPLSIIDVYTQLSSKHGSIDTVYNSPFGVLAMQWHTKLKYASNIPFTNAIGSFVVSNQFFNNLPPDLRTLLSRTGKETANRINIVSRSDSIKSIDLLKNSGINFIWNWTDHEENEMQQIRDTALMQLSQSGYISEEIFNRVNVLLKEYKSSSRQ